MKHYYSRRIVLKEKLNSHLSKLTGVSKDYYSTLRVKDFLEPKTVVSAVNNVLTLKLTLKAAKWLKYHFKLTPLELEVA